MPAARNERITLQLSQLEKGPLSLRKELLSPCDQGEFRVNEYSVKLNTIIAMYPNQAGEIKRLAQQFSDSGVKVSYMQFTAKYALCYVVFDYHARQIIHTLPTPKC